MSAAARRWRARTRRTRAWLGYAGVRLGPAGIVGLLLIVLAALLLLGRQGLQLRQEALRVRIEVAQAELQRGPPTSVPTAVQSTRSRLTQMAPLEELPEWIESVHREATAAGVEIERAEYRAPSMSTDELVRSQMVLPLRGNYVTITRWLVTVLREYPSAAVDELSLQREAVGSARLRARVVLSHYSRSSP